LTRGWDLPTKSVKNSCIEGPMIHITFGSEGNQITELKKLFFNIAHTFYTATLLTKKRKKEVVSKKKWLVVFYFFHKKHTWEKRRLSASCLFLGDADYVFCFAFRFIFIHTALFIGCFRFAFKGQIHIRLRWERFVLVLYIQYNTYIHKFIYVSTEDMFFR
jgi:hypothetical protein